MKTLGLSFIMLLLALGSCEAQTVKKFKAHNGIIFEYEVVLPTNYSSDNPYELSIIFTEVEPKNNGWSSAYASLKSVSSQNTIFILPKVPSGEADWISHPIHHGLNDLMEEMRKKYGKSKQKLHFVGVKPGNYVSYTYANMSSQYVASVSVVNDDWSKVEQAEIDRLTKKKIPVIVYEKIEKDQIKLNLSKVSFKQTSGDLTSILKQIDSSLN